MPDLLGGLLDLLFPRACALCGEGLAGPPRDEGICARCTSRLGPSGPILPAPPPLAAAGAAGAFDGPMREAVHLLKYAGRGELAASLGRRLVAALPAALPAEAVDLVVPVPLHPTRHAARGFNQAARLAGPLARALGRPLDARALARRVDTPPQTGRDASARRSNVRGAFAVPRPCAVAGRVVLLVDDVVTTGATAAACAAALRGAGARRVLLLALARAV